MQLELVGINKYMLSDPREREIKHFLRYLSIRLYTLSIHLPF